MLVSFLVPLHVWIGLLHELLAEGATLIDVKVTVAIIISLGEDRIDHSFELLLGDLWLWLLFLLLANVACASISGLDSDKVAPLEFVVDVSHG